MERCKTCKWWLTSAEPKYWIIPEGKGFCEYAMEEANGKEDALIHVFPEVGWDGAIMETSPDFGCIQHEPKEIT